MVRQSLYSKFNGDVDEAYDAIKHLPKGRLRAFSFRFKTFARRYGLQARKESDVDEWKVLKRKQEFYKKLAELCGG